MKKLSLLYLSVLTFSLIYSCKEEEFAGIPVISTVAITEISEVSVTSGGNITSDGGAVVTSRGIYWSTNPDQITDENKTSDGSGTGNYISSMSGLNGSTTYFVRAYATNVMGTAYGNQISFTTRISDADGNGYHAVSIGTQTWMVENLKVTHLNDGSEIELVSSDLEWSTASKPSYSWYFNIVPVEGSNGALYNFSTVKTGKLCPVGWIVPSDEDWKTLETYLGMPQSEADMINWRGEGTSTQLKAVEGWYVLNGIQDMYGFKALPSGSRFGITGGFENFNQGASWWTSTIYDDKNAWFRGIAIGETTIYRGNLIYENGFSVRCMKNN